MMCEGRTPDALEAESLPCGQGGGAERTLLVSSCQAPARYCLKPHSFMPMEQVGRQEKGSGRIQSCD